MRAIKIDKSDNVAVVVLDTEQGDILIVEDNEVQSLQDIQAGHKIAMEDIKKDEMVIKYGVPIGKAITDIKIGEHVHIHNVEDITEQLCVQNKEKFMKKGESIRS
ncbi:UxaA family hydrolase [Cytobacillus sp. FJAT-53684]|uniref:UxaA family hydrolase n=1 Tax=Cytobacillus mangrovibacter TaxID=3299024 RepID=A0ABW6JWZ0_9BACI